MQLPILTFVGKQVLVLEKMNFTPGNYLLEGCRQIKEKQLYLTRYKNTECAKKCRKVICGKKKSSHICRYDKPLEKRKPILK